MSQGRKIAKEKCVDKPTMTEVFDCAQLLGFQTALELDKAYCRDYWARGRVRVRLFDADGRPTSTEITNRTQMLIHCTTVRILSIEFSIHSFFPLICLLCF